MSDLKRAIHKWWGVQVQGLGLRTLLLLYHSCLLRSRQKSKTEHCVPSTVSPFAADLQPHKGLNHGFIVPLCLFFLLNLAQKWSHLLNRLYNFLNNLPKFKHLQLQWTVCKMINNQTSVSFTWTAPVHSFSIHPIIGHCFNMLLCYYTSFHWLPLINLCTNPDAQLSLSAVA